MTTFAKVTSPYIRKETSVKRMMTDVIIALLPLVIFAVYRFGMNAFTRILVAVLSMILVEVIVVMVRHKPHPRVVGFKARFLDKLKKVNITNIITPAVSAIIFSMMIPSTLPIYVVFVGASLGILVGKMFFGGLGANIFNPAATAFILVLVSFPSQFSYTGIDAVAGATPLNAIAGSLANVSTMVQNYSLVDLFLGNIPGGMGEISSILILVGAIYLFVRKAADWRITASLLSAFSVLVLVAAFALGLDNPFEVLAYQLLSGGLLFGAVYMATDPVTAPVTKPGRWIFGLLIGSLVVLIRLFGSNVEGMAYAILIGNMFAPLIDYYKWSKNNYSWKMMAGYGVALVIIAVIVFIGLGGL
jgi:electron transport complex protein RnfD